ncbi:hypothetical protein HIM_04219 [Hirsutella minnesotensis 3608]|uniref:FAD/NAD(P)-binding domain-containing protein n=1 Tax=Hirsutella minnesotensis 3608 TaxID=1043627 RepID=A0A0F7ZQ21_9HYPO|nr:hypothetical protein HIM_04219 [Hirsutella minnesotensis 3608]
MAARPRPTAAAHVAGHGFDVQIFEAGGEDSLGGIWTKVNESSGLQIHSVMYRFHPSVQWEQGYPHRNQILDQVRRLWQRYRLQDKTRFNFRVAKVYQENGKWIVNDPANGAFDGVVCAVGTCGEPKMPSIPGADQFKGSTLHSSELTGKSAKGKNIAIIGGGASAVEALEWASNTGAKKIKLVVRSDNKWIIPRNILVDTLLSLNVFGQETVLSFIPEFFLKRFFYRGLEDIIPEKGLYTGTPMVNSDLMDKLREGKAEWIRGDIQGMTEDGLTVNRRAKGVPKGGVGHEELVEADMVIMATGFKRPSLNFLPDKCFQEPYSPPNWYIQTFPPDFPSISAINCTFVDAIGTVGNWHIGIYTRLLLMFVSDPLTRPSGFWMRRWIDFTGLLKFTSPTKPLEFFSYAELIWWFIFVCCFNPFRYKWIIFALFGVGLNLPEAFVRREEKILNSRGYKYRNEGRSI